MIFLSFLLLYNNYNKHFNSIFYIDYTELPSVSSHLVQPPSSSSDVLQCFDLHVAERALLVVQQVRLDALLACLVAARDELGVLLVRAADLAQVLIRELVFVY